VVVTIFISWWPHELIFGVPADMILPSEFMETDLNDL
jgi:hypothetical protein